MCLTSALLDKQGAYITKENQPNHELVIVDLKLHDLQI